MEERIIDLTDKLTVSEVAKACRRSPETVRRWIREEKIPAVKLGLVWFIARRDLERFKQTRLYSAHGG